ncbi:unnamed protein product [Rhizopus stolonifer]
MNTLILSNIWYCLRLLQPTQSFFRSLRTIIYGFVWQRKCPLVSFDQLCLPITQGGLGVLNSQLQHLVLQIRHLCHIFDNPDPQSLVHTALSHHLSIIGGHERFNCVSFFVPAFIKHNINQHWSILHAIYKAYDHFDIVHDFSSLSISNQLKLPLNEMFTSIPDRHWLHRHSRFLASDFFLIDDQTRRLRLRAIQRHTTTPNDQLTTIPMEFHSKRHTNLDEDHTPDKLAQQFCTHPLWKKLHAGKYRQLANTTRHQSKIKLPSSRFKLFWNSSMLLQARAVWYRILNYKLPTMSYLHSIRVVASSQCRLCEDANESIQHFLILCPFKLTIWISILQHFFLDHHIQHEDIWNLLISLEPPPSLTRSQYQQLITIASTSLWCMWSSYWQTVFQDVPFPTADISAKIISQVSILQNTHPLLN